METPFADEVIANGYPYPGFTSRTPQGDVIAHVQAPALGGPDVLRRHRHDRDEQRQEQAHPRASAAR